MLHISYCENEECPKKLACFRYMCTEEDRASKIEFEHICGDWNRYARIYDIGDKKIREVTEKLQEGESECMKTNDNES